MNVVFKVGQWVWSKQHQQAGKIIESSSLWGEDFCRVWFVQIDSLVKIDNYQLCFLSEKYACTADTIAYVAAAARIAACHNEDVLLAPIGSNVIALPHQLKALNRVMSKPQVRYLLADEVGLGKTIEAGLVMRELKLRGLVRRILVVAPKGLATQWLSEMQIHFNENFQLLLPGEFESTAENTWAKHEQVICTMDSIKPLEKRSGWDFTKIATYNKQRFDDVIAAGWDLIVVDESHRLQGSTDTVARFKLGQGLADAAPYLLLLSATPHQGKTDGFHRLMSLLDRDAFPDEASITQERVKPYVIRTEKRHAIGADGKPLFLPRRTQLISVAWAAKHGPQRDLYDAVTEYVRVGYNQALAAKQNAVGFLMILMQRLVVSSPSAIKATLERRLDVLNKPSLATQTSLMTEEDWEELDGQQQVDELLNSQELSKIRVGSLKNEVQEVQWLLSIANQCVENSIDAKADALLELITQLQREENDPNLKVLIFTEFVSTQKMLANFLTSRGMSIATLNGALNMQERKQVQLRFAQNTRILISTDAGGEGLNLQFCHVIINYDIPWNPMRLEQRIGRVDRIGQQHVVRALNLVLEDTVEHRVREVLEEKLAIILEEFGVDKTSDVLDSAQAAHLFDGLYTGALQNPDAIDEEIEKALQELKLQAKVSQDSKQLFADNAPIDIQQAELLKHHPLPFWVERMTLKFLNASNGAVFNANESSWRLCWPDGETWSDCIFVGERAAIDPTTTHVTIDLPKIRSLIQCLPTWVPGQIIPCVSIPTIPDSVDGIWSLWQITLSASDLDFSDKYARQTTFLPVYISREGKSFSATAKRVWEALLSNDAMISQPSPGNDYEAIFEDVKATAILAGGDAFRLLKQRHVEAISQEREKANYAFDARRRAIDRVGLLEVRNYRLIQLEQEIEVWRESMKFREQATPELKALLILNISATFSALKNGRDD
ncbi:MAG: DEAD/DEAH box helicase family protein [Candidatus Saccharibacteria bacterium]|nr:DEAD/DEAH box helicase family protein [Moraxellaceae bacterium]